MLKKKITKVSATIRKRMESGKALRKYLVCKVCNEIEVEVQVDIATVTCAYCVQRQVAPPDLPKPQVPAGEKFPRGWALKATYIHSDGRIFERGVDTGRKYEPKKLGSEWKVELKKEMVEISSPAAERELKKILKAGLKDDNIKKKAKQVLKKEKPKKRRK